MSRFKGAHLERTCLESLLDQFWFISFMGFFQLVLRTWAVSKPLTLRRAVRWECEGEPGWELTVSICSCCLTGGCDPASELEGPVGHQTDACLYR